MENCEVKLADNPFQVNNGEQGVSPRVKRRASVSNARIPQPKSAELAPKTKSQPSPNSDELKRNGSETGGDKSDEQLMASRCYIMSPMKLRKDSRQSEDFGSALHPTKRQATPVKRKPPTKQCCATENCLNTKTQRRKFNNRNNHYCEVS